MRRDNMLCVVWAAASGMSLLLAACSRPTTESAPAPDVIARVNGRPLTLGDYAAVIGALPDSPNAIRLDDEQLVQSLIDQELLVQHALTQLELFRDPVLRRRLIQLLMRELEPAVPAEDVLRHYYESHRAQYAENRQVRFRQLRLPHTMSVRRVQQLAQRLRRAPNREEVFVSVAAHTAIANPAHDDHAFYSRRRLVRLYGPDFADRVLQLEPGDLSEPLRSTIGWHLVWVQQIAEGGAPLFSAIRETVARDWRVAERRERMNRLLARLRARATIERFIEVAPASIGD